MDSLRLIGVLTLLLAMAIESFAQLCLKVGAAGGPAIFSPPYASLACDHGLFRLPHFWTAAGVILYVVEIILWTSVLHLLDVSVAFPMGSLCFVGVALLSRIFLGEAVGRVRWGGVVCILLGTALMTM